MEDSLKLIAAAITPPNAIAGTDASGGRVESLTEAVMGMTAALVMIAHAISENADAIRDVSVAIESLSDD